MEEPGTRGWAYLQQAGRMQTDITFVSGHTPGVVGGGDVGVHVCAVCVCACVGVRWVFPHVRSDLSSLF